MKSFLKSTRASLSRCISVNIKKIKKIDTFCVDESGAFHEDGEEYTPDVCTTCKCLRGRIACEKEQCKQPNCLIPEFPVGKCCPVCPVDEFAPPETTTLPPNVSVDARARAHGRVFIVHALVHFFFFLFFLI